MQVLRPTMPELALKIAKQAADLNNQELFAKLPEMVVAAGGKYEVRGFFGVRIAKRSLNPETCVCDAEGNYLEDFKPGDSFVTEVGNLS